jgi:exodeoxyribonuclease V alpha subunit
LLNIELQAALNPAGEPKVQRFGWTFAPGDKVTQMENDYEREVYNVDIGSIADVDPVPAYAAAIHKSQRSEYPAVVILTVMGPRPLVAQAFSQHRLVLPGSLGPPI